MNLGSQLPRSRVARFIGVCAFGFFITIAPYAVAADISVTTVADDDPAPAGSLRAALAAVAENDRITFAIPVAQRDATSGKFIIKLKKALDPIRTASITINGYSQTGSRANTSNTGDNAVRLIQLDGNMADGLTINGGKCTVRGLIVTNCANAIVMQQSGGNTVDGSFIGPNQVDGVSMVDIANNTVGGTTAAARNIISGNLNGVVITGAMATDNKVQGNFIGTDASGAKAMPNRSRGVAVDGGQRNLIGAAIAKPRTPPGNVISGNGDAGVEFRSGTSNTCIGNFVGTDLTGTVAIGNQTGVLSIFSLSDTIANNIVSGSGPAMPDPNLDQNVGFGIGISSSNFVTASGNLVGTDIFGRKSIPNRTNGIVLSDSSSCDIGTDNVVSGNDRNGVAVLGGDSNNNIISGNRIGVDSAGIRRLGNRRNGVLIMDATKTLVGGEGALPKRVALKPNVIGDNGGGFGGQPVRLDANGVRISGMGALNNTIQKNFIGTDTTAKRDLGNVFDGILIDRTATSNKVTRNSIAFNNTGITVIGASKKNNLGDPNSIYSNHRIGIDLGDDGPTPLSPDEGTGPNNLQHTPILLVAQATGGGSGTLVQFLLDSNNVAPFHVEFYDNNDFDPSGMAEGERFIGAVDVVAGGPYTISLPPANILTAIATDTEGNTSEFSVWLRIPTIAADVSAQTLITQSGYNFYQSQDVYLQVVTVQNVGFTTIFGPLSLVLDNLSTNAELLSRNGFTQLTAPIGSPFVNVIGNTDVLLPGETATVVLTFVNPTNTAITYGTRLLAGAGGR